MQSIPWNSFSLGGCGIVRCEPGWSWEVRLHDFDLWYVRGGRGTMRSDQREIPLRPGVCLWMRPGKTYRATQDPSDPLTVTYLHFRPAKLGPAATKKLELPEELHSIEDAPFFTALSSKIVRLKRRSQVHPESAASRALLRRAERLFTNLLEELLAGDSSNNARDFHPCRVVIENQISRILEQPGQVISVRELAREAGLCADHYTRIFRVITGDTPRRLIQEARLEHARQLMKESAMSLGEIADLTGYSDIFHFSRIFKQRMGVSPSRWRQG